MTRGLVAGDVEGQRFVQKVIVGESLARVLVAGLQEHLDQVVILSFVGGSLDNKLEQESPQFVELLEHATLSATQQVEELDGWRTHLGDHDMFGFLDAVESNLETSVG